MQTKPLFAAVLLTAALFIASTGTAGAQAILLVVQESDAGQALSEPLPVREGVDSSLFESGFIVFDVPGAPPARDELARMARSSGADLILTISVTWEDTANTTPLRTAGRATFSAAKAATGASIADGTASATNKGREKDADRMRLGAEMGVQIAEQVKKAIDGSSSP
jgi:hypothetical protein